MKVPEFKETMLEVFKNRPDVGRMGFLSSFFTVKPQYFTNGELIDIDVINRSVKIAPVVVPNGSGAVKITPDLFTGKQVRPPLYSLSRPASLYDLMLRKPGETVFDTKYASWVAEMQNELMPSFELEQDMIRLSIEMQAAKMLQTGKVDLTDENGNVAYTLDYGMAPSHKITVSTAWDNSGDPIADLKGAMDVIRKDGHCDVSTAIFGAKAWEAFISDANVLKLFQKDVLNIAALNPELVDKGGEYMGYIMLGAYKVNLFTYSATYEAFENTTQYPFVDDDKVILLPNKERLDLRLMYARHPVIPGGTVFDDIVPEELIVENRIRYTQRVIADIPRNVFEAETSSRPLCLPVSIDRIAVLSGTVTP